MKTIYLLSILLFFLSILTCCNKTQVISTEYQYLSAKMKPYMFLTNSYWVFQNDSTGDLDTILVTSNDKDFCVVYPGAHGTTIVKAEYFKINFKSSYTLKTDNDFLLDGVILRRGPSEYCYEGQPIFVFNWNGGFENDGLTRLDSFQNWTINGNTFNNVDKIKITKAKQRRPAFDYDTYLYFADSIGIIKKETYLNNGYIESWSIVSWKLLR